MTQRYQIAVFEYGDPQPTIRTVVLPEEWGTARAAMDEIEVELQGLCNDEVIERFTVTDLPCTDMDKVEALKWIEQLRKEGEV